MKNQPPKVKVVSKPSLSITLKSMEIGVPTLFTNIQFKVTSTRVCASELSNKGFKFEISEAGMVNEYLVTRLK